MPRRKVQIGDRVRWYEDHNVVGVVVEIEPRKRLASSRAEDRWCCIEWPLSSLTTEGQPRREWWSEVDMVRPLLVTKESSEKPEEELVEEFKRWKEMVKSEGSDTPGAG